MQWRALKNSRRSQVRFGSGCGLSTRELTRSQSAMRCRLRWLA